MSKLTKSMAAMTTALAVTLSAGAALADWPEKPITVVVPYGAGGDSDLTTRVWADAMEDKLGVPVVVVNKAGGGGVVGTAFVANSKPDGYTLINAGLGNMLVTPNFSQTPYTFDSFVPVVKMTAVPLAIVVAEDSPYKTFEDFVAASKAETLTQGSWGAASSGTTLGRIIAGQAGYEPKFVHANTTAESMVAVVGGHIDSAVSFPPAFGPHVAAGRARALVMNQKMDAYPDVPTFAEKGIEGNLEGWSGVFAPAGVPQEVVDKLIAATTEIMKEERVLTAYDNMGAVVDFRHGDDWIASMRATSDIMKEAAKTMKK